MTEHIKIANHDGILSLTMARPDKKNALTNAMYGALADAIEGAESDPDRPRRADPGRGRHVHRRQRRRRVRGDCRRQCFRANGMSAVSLHSLARSSRPLVAAVQGRAVGIGTTMLLHCDLVVLADNALLSTPFVSLALVPEAASSLLMPLRIGYARAFEMFALGETVDAGSALAWGLANRVVSLDKLDGEAKALAARLAKQPAGAVVHHQAADAQSGSVDDADAGGKRAVRRTAENRGGPRGLFGVRRAPAAGFSEAREATGVIVGARAHIAPPPKRSLLDVGGDEHAMVAQQVLQGLQRRHAAFRILLAIAAAEADAADDFVIDDDRKATDEHRKPALEAPLDPERLVAGQRGTVRRLVEQMGRTLVSAAVNALFHAIWDP